MLGIIIICAVAKYIFIIPVLIITCLYIYRHEQEDGDQLPYTYIIYTSYMIIHANVDIGVSPRTSPFEFMDYHGDSRSGSSWT